ncbi:hypothetical protein ACEN4E_05570 [Latilactobacillus sakei]|uniref:hypothetical protein n=1 Tax=Latilactobacillus sakei TaxID=1599 RepID=UPI003888165C
MKTTYVESNKTWVISHLTMDEHQMARRLVSILKHEGKEVVLLPTDFEVTKKQPRFFEWLFKREPIRNQVVQLDTERDRKSVVGKKDESSSTSEKPITEFISKMDYYEQINLHIALLMADNPKLSTDEAYEFATTHFSTNDHTSLRYYLDKAMHVTTYK